MQTTPNTIPAGLKDLNQWVVWKYINKDGRPTKVLYSPQTGKPAKSNAAATWGTLAAAQKALTTGKYEGLGIVLTNGLCGIDLDHVINEAGEIEDPAAAEIISNMDSYTEISPSGTGIHILFKGVIYTTDEYYSHKGNIEIYSGGRYFTFTGNALDPVKPIEERTEQAQSIQEKYYKKPATSTAVAQPTRAADINLDDETLIEKAKAAANGGKFTRLWNGDFQGEYPSQSEADQALCNMLAWWTNKDFNQIDNLFRQSGLMRGKWEKHTKYREDTINKAIAAVTGGYNPTQGKGYTATGGRGNALEEADETSSFYDGNKFLHNVFGSYLMNKHIIAKIDDQMMIYKNGVYVEARKHIEKISLSHIDRLTINQRREVTAYIQTLADDRKRETPHLIALNNGIFNLKDNTLHDFTPETVLTNRYPVTYNPAITEHAAVDNFIRSITNNDNELSQVLYEIFGYTLYQRNFLGKFFILYGEGGNGKSVLLKMLKAFCGVENVSSVPLEELGTTFVNTGLYNKVVNIGDDIDGSSIKLTGHLKKFTTGERVNVQHKGQAPFEFENFAKLFFSTNRIPNIYDNSDGLNDRIVIIPLLQRFRGTSKDDQFLIDKITTEEALSYMLNKAIEGLHRLKDNKKLTTCKVIDDYMKDFQRTNNPVNEFREECEEGGDYPITERDLFRNIYENYKQWCKDCHRTPLNKSVFGKEFLRGGKYKADRQRAGYFYVRTN